MNSKKYFTLYQEHFRLDGGAMFGIIPRPLWSKSFPPDEENRIDLSLRLLLIQQKDANILIDTGIGQHYNSKFKNRFAIEKKFDFEKSLKSLGISCEKITDIILSHLHFDHVGGLCQQKGLLFPNAKIHLHKKHFEYACSPTDRDKGSFLKDDFLPIIDEYEKRKLVNWYCDEEGPFIIKEAGLYFRCSHGHTPYMMHPYDEKIIYMADLVPTASHFPIPWVMAYDMAPGKSTEEKKQFYDFIFKKNLLMIFEHDPFFYGGYITKNQNSEHVLDLKKCHDKFFSQEIFTT